MNIKECFVEEYQGHRWCFEVKRGKAYMTDTLGIFPTVEMPPDVAKTLAKQLGALQKYQEKDRKNLLLPNLLLDFAKENKDIDKDVIIALINKMDIIIH